MRDPPRPNTCERPIANAYTPPSAIATARAHDHSAAEVREDGDGGVEGGAAQGDGAVEDRPVQGPPGASAVGPEPIIGAMPATGPSETPAQGRLHESWMRLALAQARAAEATGDVPIGAVVIGPEGAVLAVGRNEREALGDPTAHAEIQAIRAAAAARQAQDEAHDGACSGWRLADCTLLVTLEPCAMCAGAIVLARIPRVVFGAWDEKAGAAGSVFDILRERRLNHWVEVYPGVLEDECGAILREFFAGHRG